MNYKLHLPQHKAEAQTDNVGVSLITILGNRQSLVAVCHAQVHSPLWSRTGLCEGSLQVASVRA